MKVFRKQIIIGIDYAIKNNFDYVLILINNDTIVERNLIEVFIENSTG